MKKKFVLTLSFITVLIWGIIIYSVAGAVFFNIEDGTGINTTSENIPVSKNFTANSKKFEFEYIEKDPFILSHKKEIEERTVFHNPIKTETKEENPIAIKFTIGGVVINGENKNIVLNDETNSNVVFLKEGESYQGLKIVRVSKQEVELLHISSGDKIISPLK